MLVGVTPCQENWDPRALRVPQWGWVTTQVRRADVHFDPSIDFLRASAVWQDDNDMTIVEAVFDNFALIHTVKTKPTGVQIINNLYSKCTGAFKGLCCARWNVDRSSNYAPLWTQRAAPSTTPSCRPSLRSTPWAPACSRKTSSSWKWMVSYQES